VEVEQDAAKCKVSELENQPKEDTSEVDSIVQPHTLNGFTVTKLHNLMGLQDNNKKQEWSRIRVSTF